MRDFPRALSTVVLFLVSGALFQGSRGSAQVVVEQTPAHKKQIKYFSLEHRTPDQMSEEDRRLVDPRKKELAAEAEFFGYDINGPGWTYEQAICPQFPDTVLLHYLYKFPDDTQSQFTALIPRGAGRVRVVPVLYRNASPYSPAAKNPRNFTIFNSLVPADVAKQDAGPEGNWLSLGVCYAEMVGSRPNVPDDPSLDTATIKAPVATYRYDTTTKQRQVQFSDRDSPKVFKIWTISINEQGRVTGAENEDYDTYVARVVQAPEPKGSPTTPAEPPSRIIPEPPSTVKPEPPQPPSTVKPVPPASQPQ
jgi:hypothetical protein